MSIPLQDSMLLQLQILKVKAAMTVALLELMFSMKHSLSVSLSPSSKIILVASVETKILMNAGADQDFADNLVKWAGVIRKTFFDGGVDEVITTRRLVHIVQAYQYLW